VSFAGLVGDISIEAGSFFQSTPRPPHDIGTCTDASWASGANVYSQFDAPSGAERQCVKVMVTLCDRYLDVKLPPETVLAHCGLEAKLPLPSFPANRHCRKDLACSSPPGTLLAPCPTLHRSALSIRRALRRRRLVIVAN
jgi:hypothetical protein